jgi:hypothetical protein
LSDTSQKLVLFVLPAALIVLAYDGIYGKIITRMGEYSLSAAAAAALCAVFTDPALRVVLKKVADAEVDGLHIEGAVVQDVLQRRFQ